MKKTSILLATLILIAMALTGCGENGAGSGAESDEAIELGYVQWACANANSHMIKAVLEDQYDVDINLRNMDAGLLWQGLATGDIDFMVTAWLPGTHASYYEELKDEVVDLGPMYEGAAIGLVVPEYVAIDSIEELNDHASQLGGRIVGIDAGAGIMNAATQALEDYDLDLALMTSSDAAMTAELKAAYDNEEWIVVTGWAPHWKFGSFDLKFLEDPMMSFGGEETIHAFTRLGFAENHPEIHAFLENYSLTTEQFGSLINAVEEHGDNEAGARAWIQENQELVNSWFPE